MSITRRVSTNKNIRSSFLPLDCVHRTSLAASCAYFGGNLHPGRAQQQLLLVAALRGGDTDKRDPCLSSGCCNVYHV